jgi:hypothetical protein
VETPHARLTALGNQLIDIHLRLRDELGQLRDSVDDYLAGTGQRPRELPAHCLAFCAAVTRHHTGEDTGAFPVLAAASPDLAPVIAELERDHLLVSGALAQLDALLRGLSPGLGRAEGRRVKQELDTLAALLETHFTYEERKLVAALNALDARAAEVDDLFGARTTTTPRPR